MKLIEFLKFNPHERLPKGTLAKKIAMDNIATYTRMPKGFSVETYGGGAKFRNGDTLVARITPCLENGKTACCNILNANEVGFGSTEYIVLRAKHGISLPLFVYYLATSKIIRDPAIKSMIGSSGRQRVQQTVLAELEIPDISLAEQQHIVDILGSIDDKIENNEKIIEKLFILGNQMYLKTIEKNKCKCVTFGNIIQFVKGKTPREIGTAQLPYINMEAAKSGKYELTFSDGMVLCAERDILMVMDGASSGMVFTGQKGIVSSTFAKLVVPSEYQEIIYWALLGQQNSIGQQNTGSAIPHANKDFINSLLLYLPKGNKTQEELRSIREKIYGLKRENAKLSELKEQYLKKFFR